MKKKLALGLTLVILLVAALVWWFYDPYAPTAYVGITTYEMPRYHRMNFESSIYRVDLISGEVNEVITPSNMSRIQRIALDRENDYLYVSGGTPHENNSQEEKIKIYDLNNYEIQRKLEVPTGKTSMIRISPDGRRLFMSNPIRPDKREKKLKNPEKQKETWLLDPETGDFIKGIDRWPRSGAFISEDGSYFYMFPANKEIGTGKWVYDVDNDTLSVGFARDTDRLFEESGGFFFGDEEYNFPRMEGWSPMKIYDRETYEKLGEVDIYQGIDEYRISKKYSTKPEMITQDGKLRVVGIVLDGEHPGDPSTHLIRTIDLEKHKVLHTVEIYKGLANQTNIVAY